MSTTLFTNARIFDGESEHCPGGMSVLVEDGTIREVSAGPIRSESARVIDCGGRTLMPGLIDAHVHVYASGVNAQLVDQAGESYRAAHATRMLGHALDCGFTTVRDTGGGDYGIYRALEDRLIRGPRLVYSGKALSMTGGHGDFRAMSQHAHGLCSCGSYNSLCVLADGVDECIKAAREELRRGAHFIKVMGSGGVASPTDPIWMNQYREDEIRAIVNETDERRTYTTAHCHPTEAIRRCVAAGVRCIEHGTLIDDPTARYVAEQGAWIVPTMVIIFGLVELGKKLGFPAVSQAKAEIAFKQALSGMEAMKRAGVKTGFGTDLLGDLYTMQCREFTIRSEVYTPLEILRQVTSVNAEIVLQKDRLGCVKPEAIADLIVVDGDPLEDIGLLAANGSKLAVIMQNGTLVKQTLA